MVPDIWDEVIVDDPEWFAAITHWDDVTAPTSRVHLLAGELGVANTVRSMEGLDYLESDWIRLRDPGGALAGEWTAAGSLDDDSMSFTDVARLVTAMLVDAGWDADFASRRSSSRSDRCPLIIRAITSAEGVEAEGDASREAGLLGPGQRVEEAAVHVAVEALELRLSQRFRSWAWTSAARSSRATVDWCE